MGPHHLVQGIVGTSRDVAGWVQPGDFLLQEFIDCKVPATADRLSPGPGLGRSSASSAGRSGRFLAGHSERHATRGCGSACQLARRSARSSMQRACTFSPWEHGISAHKELTDESPVD